MLAAIAVILFFIWIAGLALHFFGGFIYLFLVAAIILGISHFLGGKKTNP